MNYAVEWVPAAEQELADLWLGAASRAEVTRAAHAIDQELAVNAHEKGESRAGDDRVLLVAPLGVLFEADPAQQRVFVWHVWAFR